MPDSVLLLVALAAATLLALWFAWRRVVRCACELDLEATHEHFHAHVALDGVHVTEGDEVRVHGAPSRIGLGERRTLRAHAEVRRASLPRRLWTRLIGATHISDLYEVGFEG